MSAPPSASSDALFAFIERLQGDRPWGSVLDAGTGEHSLQWIAGLPTARWTAVTGGEARARELRAHFGARVRPADRLVTGNWQDPALLAGELYDVVLADYLLGAIDGFAPYFQDRLFARLRPLVGQRLYAVGLAPYPDDDDSPGAALIREIARLRDACILLAGHRCYREYPLDWVLRHVEAAGFSVVDAVEMPIVYRRRFVDGQLDVCRRKLPLIADPGLRASLDRHIEELRARARPLADAGIRFGHDWVLAAEPR
jgi:hypothetical protein